ncbi:MAG: SigE family RNA polymerase sigma factor [Micrococcales bacterium]|nr:SigE family RNA polymerase sigma factor [Micrococcales bacterium]
MSMTSVVPSQTQEVRVTRDEEFSQFMEQAMAGLTRTAWHLTGDEHQAADLVRQTLVRTYTRWSRARHGPLPFARKVMVSHRMAKPRRQGAPDQAEGSPALAERDRLVQALGALEASQRRAVVLLYVEGLDEVEVALTLGQPVAMVKVEGARGLQRLREVLDGARL